MLTWYCDSCGDEFYTGMNKEPEFCPYCKSTDITSDDGLIIEP